MSLTREQIAQELKEKNLKVLGLKSNATKKNIRQAYQRLAKKYHPDLNPDNVERATAEFQKINEAHQFLIDPSVREEEINNVLRKQSNVSNNVSPQPKQDQTEQVVQKNESVLKKGCKILGLYYEDLLDATKDAKAMKDFIKKAEESAIKKNLVNFNKNDKADDGQLTFGEAQEKNHDNVRGHIEENFNAPNIENANMRMFFESLNNLIKTLLHEYATICYERTMRQEKQAQQDTAEDKQLNDQQPEQEQANRSKQRNKFSKARVLRSIKHSSQEKSLQHVKAGASVSENVQQQQTQAQSQIKIGV